jgi:hypothetical protein
MKALFGRCLTRFFALQVAFAARSRPKSIVPPRASRPNRDPGNSPALVDGVGFFSDPLVQIIAAHTEFAKFLDWNFSASAFTIMTLGHWETPFLR